MNDRGVPLVDLHRIHGPIRDELLKEIAAVVSNGDFILGSAVTRFEQEFASYVGVDYGIGVGSGTAALTVATMASGIEPGLEVIVPAHTYIATALGVMHAGAVPVFVTSTPRSGLIDLDSAAASVTGRTAAVVPVHLYGQPCSMDEVAQFADRTAWLSSKTPLKLTVRSGMVRMLDHSGARPHLASIRRRTSVPLATAE